MLQLFKVMQIQLYIFPSVNQLPEGKLGATYEGPADNGEVVEIPFDEPITGRYLIITIVGNEETTKSVLHILTLCEVRVIYGKFFSKFWTRE